VKLEKSQKIDTGGIVEQAFHESMTGEHPFGWTPADYERDKLTYFSGFTSCLSLLDFLARKGDLEEVTKTTGHVQAEVDWFLAGMADEPNRANNGNGRKK
jgi:hypothetical protein